jgi:hypothetical protein
MKINTIKYKITTHDDNGNAIKENAEYTPIVYDAIFWKGNYEPTAFIIDHLGCSPSDLKTIEEVEDAFEWMLGIGK